jgi:sulfur carrier protein
MIKTFINGKEAELEKSCTLAELIESRGLVLGRVVAEVNGEILTRDTYASIIINEGDKIELINFVGGG